MPQHEPIDEEAILAYANTPKPNGTMPSRVDVAAKFGINVVTANKVLLRSPSHARQASAQVREKKDGQTVLNEITRYQSEHGWAPSQREIGEACDMMPSRVNYLLRYLEHEGLIEVGPQARQIKVVGSKMVIPQVTM